MTTSNASYGVIGGTGLDSLPEFELIASHQIDTPYGVPSAPVQEGLVAGCGVYFMPRHGTEHHLPPHQINYRANIWALKSLGVSQLIALFAVGGITESMRPGHLVLPDQLIDYTWGREHTFDEGTNGPLMHVEFTEPYSKILRQALIEAAISCQLPHHTHATYGATQGPRLETAAEIQRLLRDGCDLVGMTGMPEAALAREAGLAYAGVCMVVNAAAGVGDEPITLDAIRDTLTAEVAAVRLLLQAFFS